MLTAIASQLDAIENLLWTYFGVPIVVLLGVYFTVKSGFFQIRQLPTVFKTFYGFAFGMIQLIKSLFLFDLKSAKKAYKKCKRIAFIKDDPYWNFKKWVDLEAQFGYRSTFFFLARKRRFLFKYKDLRYSLNQTKVANAINYLQKKTCNRREKTVTRIKNC